MRELEVNPCLTICTWSATGEELDGLRLFRCGGCGSEWVRTQGWTPVSADGTVSPEVAAEAALRATSAGGAAPAGSAGTGTTTGS